MTQLGCTPVSVSNLFSRTDTYSLPFFSVTLKWSPIFSQLSRRFSTPRPTYLYLNAPMAACLLMSRYNWHKNKDKKFACIQGHVNDIPYFFQGLLQSYITIITHRYISSGLAPIKYNYNEIYISRACSNAKATLCLTSSRGASLAAPMLIFVIRCSFYSQLWISIKLFLQHGKYYIHRSNITNILVVR